MTKAMKKVTCLACVAVMGLGAAMFAACDDQGSNNPGGDTNREVEELHLRLLLRRSSHGEARFRL